MADASDAAGGNVGGTANGWRRQVGVDRLPDRRDAHREIPVGDDVPEAAHFAPGDFGMSGDEVGRHLPRCLADHDEIVLDCLDCPLIVLEVINDMPEVNFWMRDTASRMSWMRSFVLRGTQRLAHHAIANRRLQCVRRQEVHALAEPLLELIAKSSQREHPD
jgi:hypothetical protein